MCEEVCLLARNNPWIKPYLKWAGGKRQLLPEIKRYIPQKYDMYFEPFIGAGAVFFSQQPKKAIINDANSQLVTTYQVIKENVEALIEELNIHILNNNEAYYYQIREQDRNANFNQLSNIQKAARLIYLNKTCYNGLYRVNSQGLFNVPYGKYKNPTICDMPVLRAISTYLNSNNIQILNGDFADSITTATKNSFVYLDPPYHSPSNTNFTGYQAEGFNEQEQIRLRDTILELTARGTKCLLSNSDTQFIRDLYQDNTIFTIETVTATRAINADANGRGRVNEVLIKNW
jgi:DNA adenine methylase